MAKVFGDESYDDRGQRVFAVAAIVGTDGQWDEFVSAWKKITGGQEFHAAEWESEFAKDPDRSKHQKRLESYRKLTELLAWSGMHGWGVGVDLVGYRKAFPHITTDWAYHKCFLETVIRIIRDSIGLGHRDLKFTFDGRQGQGSLTTLYDDITSWPEWAEFPLSFADEISFATRKNPKVQAADLFARETMKGLDRYLQGLPRRKSLTTLGTSCRHFQFHYLMDEYFAQMEAALREKIRRTRKNYARWLLSVNAQDTIENRYRFKMWEDAKILRRKQKSKSHHG
jgi:hypothetical protein